MAKLGTLVDGFDGGLSAAWTSSRVTTSASSAVFTPTGSGQSARIDTVTGNNWDLFSSQILFSNVVAATTGTSPNFEILVAEDGDPTNSLQIEVASGNIVFRNRVGGFGDPDQASFTYVPGTFAHLRIRALGSAVFMESSPDGATWTNRHTVAIVTDPWMSSVKVTIEARNNTSGVVSTVGGVNSFVPASVPPPDPTTIPTPTFRDEFTDFSLATDSGGGRWRNKGYELGGTLDVGYKDAAGSNWNISPTQHPTHNPFSIVDNGSGGTALRITGKRLGSDIAAYVHTQDANVEWESGMLVSNHLTPTGMAAPLTWRYGYFEWRMRFPTPARGMFPALWLFNNIPDADRGDGTAESGAELDILEVFGNSLGRPFSSGVHWRSKGLDNDYPSGGSRLERNVSTSDLDTTTWHRYGLDWTANRIVFYRDGVEIGRLEGEEAAWFQGADLGIRMNLAIDPVWEPPQTSPLRTTVSDPPLGFEYRMEIDYVRYWTSMPTNLGTGTYDPFVSTSTTPPPLSVIAHDRYTDWVKNGLESVTKWAVRNGLSWTKPNGEIGAKVLIGEYGHPAPNETPQWTEYDRTKWNIQHQAYQRHLVRTGAIGTYWIASHRGWFRTADLPSGVYETLSHTYDATTGANFTTLRPGAPLRDAPDKSTVGPIGVRGYGDAISPKGVNLGSMQDGVDPGDIPPLAAIQGLAAQGIKVFRVPIQWRFLQSGVGAPLTSATIAALQDVANRIGSVGGAMIIDIHDAQQFRSISNQLMTDAQFVDLWTKLSTVFKAQSHVWYGLMNEPHDGPSNGTESASVTQWERASQAAVTAIRANGDTSRIFVGSYHYSGFNELALRHNDWWITDSANNTWLEIHHYWDPFNGGNYAENGQRDPWHGYDYYAAKMADGEEAGLVAGTWTEDPNDLASIFGLASSTPPTRAKVSALTETFDAGSIDTARWQPSGSSKVVQGVLDIPLLPNSNYTGLRSAQVMDLTGSDAFATVDVSAMTKASEELHFIIRSSTVPGNEVRFTYVNGTLTAYNYGGAGGPFVDSGGATPTVYNATNHARWRIVHDATANTITWQTATLTGPWVNFRGPIPAPTWGIDSVVLVLEGADKAAS